MERKRKTSPSADENQKKRAKGAHEERESEESSDDEMKGVSGEKGAEAPVDEANNEDTPYSFNCEIRQLLHVKTGMTGNDILLHFIKSGLHDADWPYSTIVVCLIHHLDDAKQSKHTVFIRENTEDEHAEAKLIKYINEEVHPANVRSITIYSNYSPCNMDGYMCSTKLQELREKLPVDSKMLIKFSALYKVKRPSCFELRSCRGKHVSEEISEGSPVAYDKLQTLGAMPFQEGEWKELIELLMKYNEDQKYGQQDLHEVRNGDLYGKRRDEEDELMLKDFIESTRASDTENTQSTPKKTPSTEEPPRPSKGQATGGTTDVGSLKRKLFKK